MSSGNFVVQFAAGTLTALLQDPQACQPPRVRSRALHRAWQMRTLQETHNRLQEEFQREGKHNGKDDRACQVERRKDAQCKNATEKECLRIRWQRHLRLNIRRHSLGLRRAIVRDGRQGGWDAPVAERQQPRVLPPNVRKTASMA
jgi:hypothetical protein